MQILISVIALLVVVVPLIVLLWSGVAFMLRIMWRIYKDELQ